MSVALSYEFLRCFENELVINLNKVILPCDTISRVGYLSLLYAFLNTISVGYSSTSGDLITLYTSNLEV